MSSAHTHHDHHHHHHLHAQVEWGIDLQTEHERYLTEEIFMQPVIVYNYPKASLSRSTISFLSVAACIWRCATRIVCPCDHGPTNTTATRA
jgi:hypothetical protein